MSWWKELRGSVKLREPLSKHTTYRIGGAARFFIEPADNADLQLLLKRLRCHAVPVRVMGMGSNLLISDRGVNAAVIRLRAPAFKTVVFDRNCVVVGAGVALAQLVVACAERGLSGLEFLVGIPGTVGGALVTNAGQAQGGRSISCCVGEVTVMTSAGVVVRRRKKDLVFGYRSSNLSGSIILGAVLRLRAASKREIVRDMNTYILVRRQSHDWRARSCGSVFKNPPAVSAGRLIESCGFKGRRIGDACVSSQHANFIVNLGCARAQDVRALMAEITREVKKKFHVQLEPEVQLW